MNILITGGAGFIGSNLISYLLKNTHYNLYSLDNYSSGKRENEIKDPRVKYICGNTWEINEIQMLCDNQFEYVYHFGEFSRIVYSFDVPSTTFQSNTYGTQQVLEFCVRKKAKLIYSGSSSIFGNDMQDQHLNPYSWTKSKNIELIKNYETWFGLEYAICYFFNVYGPGQICEGNYATVVGIFEKQYSEGKPLTIVEPGTQRRAFTHIDDIVSGIYLTATKGIGDGYFLGTEKNVEINDLAKMFNTETVYIPERKGERLQSLLHTSKVRTELGWTTNIDLESYVKQFIKNHETKIIGIIGNGFVGKATKLLKCDNIKCIVYDKNPQLCEPQNTELKDLLSCDIIFISVPTPMKPDKSCHTNIVTNVINDLKHIDYKGRICVRSTVPVGFCKSHDVDFMPEFLTEKNWEKDFKMCEKWIIGINNDDKSIKDLYTSIFQIAKKNNVIDFDKVVFDDTNTCELIKYTRNVFLATKVSFCNELFNFAKKYNIDWDTFSDICFSDKRIGVSHTQVPGYDGKYGFGGTCFPKDVNSLVIQIENIDVQCPLIKSVVLRNETIDRTEQDWNDNKERAVIDH